MNILFVTTSHGHFGDEKRKTGLWFEELAAPYYVFRDAGAAITIASPAGGMPPIDPASEQPDAQTVATRRLAADGEAMTKLFSSLRLDEVAAMDFDAIFYPGGHGPLWDLAEDKRSIGILEDALLLDIPIGSVCHGPAAFRHVKRADGRPMVEGRAVTAFSNSEEEAAGSAGSVPYLVESMLREQGGLYSKSQNWLNHVVVDGLLVTGQNPVSSLQTAERLLRVTSEIEKSVVGVP